MKKIIISFIILTGGFGPSAMAAISHNGTDIFISGTETGDTLRAYITTNGLGTVNNNDIIFSRDLNIQANADFTDDNSVYTFPLSYRFEPQTNCTVNFTDVVLRYIGNQKVHSFNQAYTANWTRVNYIQGVESGRSDFFNNGNYTFNLSDVTFVSYGASDFLHFQSEATLENITITNAQGGLIFEPGSRNIGTTMIIKNLKLDGVSSFVQPSGGQGELRTENMEWTNTTWTHGTGRGNSFNHINPIKPVGWVQYTGGDGDDYVREYYTHDVQIVDENSVPISGATVRLLRDDLSNQVYLQTTDANGQIPQQEVLTHDRGAGVTATDYGDFEIGVYSYLHSIGSGTKALQNGQIDETILIGSDPNITETNQATVNAYTEITNFDRLYDRAKLWKVQTANLSLPSISSQLINGTGTVLDLGTVNISIDANAVSAFDFNSGSNTITINANTMDCSSGNFKALSTTGAVTFANGAAPGTCIFNDSSGTNGVLTLTGIDNANVLIYDDASVGDDTISYLISQNGTISIPFDATSSTDYQVVVRRAGYSEVNFEFDPSSGGNFEFPISQTQGLTIEGTAIYQNTGDLAKITMDFPALRINVGDFTINAQEFYDTLQNIEVTETAMKNPRIANFDGESQILLLNSYQIRNRDGATTVPGINAFIFAASGGILDSSNGSVQFLADATATVDKQDQIVKMIEAMQGSAWDNTNDVFALPNANLSDITGTGFDSLNDSLSSLVDSMLDRGILDVNTAKDLMQ